MRKKIVAGNWKMNLNKSEADILYNDLESKTYPDDVEVIIATASIYLDSFSNASNVSISSQDVSACLLYTSPSPRDATLSRMPSSA